MIKKAVLFFFVLIIPLHVYGAVEAPEFNIWITPPDAKPGEAIEIHAFVYNNTTKNVTATISFKVSAKEIGKSTISIPAETAKAAKISWEFPQEKTEVLVEVTNAVDTRKKNVPELVGVVGTVTIEENNTKGSLALPSQQAIKKWFGSIFATIEPFRIKQSDHYTELRNNTRDKLGLGSKNGMLPDLSEPETPAVPGDDEESLRAGSVTTARQLNIGNYLTYLYASALAALFTNIAVFYITLILVILLVLRFIFSRF